MSSSGSSQFGRKASLVVSGGGQALDLSALRFKFYVYQSDLQSPNHLICRVYNLSGTTSQQVQAEYTRVTLQAGYENGPYGVIFDGTIRQFFRGAQGDPHTRTKATRAVRESPTETFLEINAGDGDDPYNFALVKQTVAAGYDDTDVAKIANQQMGTTLGALPDQFGGNPAPRGKVMFGMARDQLRQITTPAGFRWSLQNGKLVLIANTAYLPGTAVILNAQTGMLGTPEQTQDGIRVDALLNPQIQIGTTVQLKNADITQSDFSADYTAFNYPPPLSGNGQYRVLVSEYEGDTRGTEWYSHLTCISVDPSSAPSNSVQAYG